MFLSVEDPAGHKPVKNLAKSIDIRLSANQCYSPILQFWGGVLPRPHSFICKGHALAIVEEKTDSKVTDYWSLAIFLKKYVCGLKIAMDNTATVGISYTLTNRPKKLKTVQYTPVPEISITECASRTVLCYDKWFFP